MNNTWITFAINMLVVLAFNYALVLPALKEGKKSLVLTVGAACSFLLVFMLDGPTYFAGPLTSSEEVVLMGFVSVFFAYVRLGYKHLNS